MESQEKISIGNVVESKYLVGFWRVINKSFVGSVTLVDLSDSELTLIISGKMAKTLQLVD
jgi:hypothetical protein